LAERVAVLAWRLRRVGAFEAGVVALGSDAAVRRVRGEAGQGETDHAADTHSSVAALRRQVADLAQAVERFTQLVAQFGSLNVAADRDKFDGRQAMTLLQVLPLYLPARPPGMSDDYDPDDEDFYDDEDDDTDSWGRPTHDPRTTPTHRRFLLALEVPEGLHADPHSWCGWTAGAVRAGADRIASTRRWAGAKLLAHAVAGVTADLERQRADLDRRRQELAAAEGRAAADEAEARRRALVPAKEAVDVVLRYEGHLQRQLTQTLHELERRQALRSTNPPHPPATVDVTVHAAEGVTLPALGSG
jgi:hypothetical protein